MIVSVVMLVCTIINIDMICISSLIAIIVVIVITIIIVAQLQILCVVLCVRLSCSSSCIMMDRVDLDPNGPRTHQCIWLYMCMSSACVALRTLLDVRRCIDA